MSYNRVAAEGRWTRRRAEEWYGGLPWPVGCNYIPATAVNQLEMWQGDSFDEETMDRELSWAEGLGLNLLRVFLHDLAWMDDAAGFKARVGKFLAIAAGHGMRVMPVLFDDCWNDGPSPGPQPAPIPGVHNSRWVQSPGSKAVRDPRTWTRLEAYVRDMVGAFAADDRILLWDLYNEPGNGFLPALSLPQPAKALRLARGALGQLLLPSPTLPLLRRTFEWARAARPRQPLTAGLWFAHPFLTRFLLAESDVISFHNYGNARSLESEIRRLKSLGRPVLCTEYMARTKGSLFATHLPIFRREKVGCMNWGLVSGRTQTIWPWDARGEGEEPEVWYHDILRRDGSPYDPVEAEIIRKHTAATGR